MSKRWLIAVVFLSIAPVLSAQRVLTASGSYTYYAPSNITLDQAKAVALERAKIQIIADNFGTVVGVMNHTRIENDSGESSVSFLSLGESEVRGEWLETVGKPVFDVRYEDHLQVVSVTVRGTIREIVESRIPVEVKVLRNGTDDRFESEVFKKGDDFFVSFKAPVDGFVAVFLYDKDGVSRLLPLINEKVGARLVTANYRDVFFTKRIPEYDISKGIVIESIKSEYTMDCDADNELDRLYVVFSPNEFSRPNDEISDDETLPAFLSFEQFQRWLSRSRRQDKVMTVTIKDILIRK